MGAFTPVVADIQWQGMSFLNEMCGGIAERQEACGKSAPFQADVSAGDDVQAASFWSGLQGALETMYGSFVNHTVTIEGATSITMFSRSAWITEAGMGGPKSSAGDCFRRATTIPTDWTDYSDAAYSYGYMQAGDIIGPWIFQDIQDGLMAMQWTKKTTSAGASTGIDWQAKGENQWTSPFYLGSDADCDTARTNAINDYASAWFDTSSSPLVRYYYWANRSKYYNSGGASPVWRWREGRARGKPKFLSIVVPAGITYDWDAYIIVTISNANPDPDSPGSGWTTTAAYYTYGNAAGASDTALQTGYPTSAESDLLSGWSCPLSDPTNSSENAYSQDAALILKWNFTNE